MSKFNRGKPTRWQVWRKAMRTGALRMCSIVVAMSLVPLPAPAQVAAPPAPSAPEDAAATRDFNPEQLDALLAPIALYPDDLLVQVLMASTFPIEIVEASRWRDKENNKALTGEALAKALETADLGPERQIADAVPAGARADERQSDLDAATRLRVRRAAE